MQNTRMLASFEDILEPRRQEISNFIWVSRELSTKVPYKQIRKYSPYEIKLEVLNSPRIQTLIEKECIKENSSRNDLINKIKYILDEIGYNRKLQIIRWLGLVLAKIKTQVCSAIYVNRLSITRLRNEMGNVPVMYVPSHRSYADFILMSYICFHYDIEIPSIAAGMDFHGMKGMGSVLRNTGAFFMRRSYNDDSLYWDTFREYVHQLVTKGELGIEFFIEGTRSRSGKSLFPKLGLFSMILKAFFSGEVPDILFVPINISYERVMEEKLFAFELLGVPKPKESTSAFFKSLSLVKEKYGNVYVNFGSPISAYQYFGDKVDRSSHCTKPLYMQNPTEKERAVTALLAQSIVRNQQKLCVISTFNLVAIIIIELMIYKNGMITIEKLLREMLWLKEVMERLGAVTDFTGEVENVLEMFVVHRSLIKLSDDGEVKLVRNEQIANNIDRTHLKGHPLQDETMVRAVPFMTLQIYVNSTLHYFINPSLTTIVLRKYKSITKDVLFLDYVFLRSVFGKEFVLFPMYEQMEFEDSLRMLQDTKVLNISGDFIQLNSNEKLQHLLFNLLQPFFLTYYFVCINLNSAEIVTGNALKKTCARITVTSLTQTWKTNVYISVSGIITAVQHVMENNECSESHIYTTTQFQIEKLLNVRKSIHPYTLSLDTISNCLQSLTDLSAVQKSKRNSSVIYTIQHEILSEIITQLDNYVILLTPGLKMPTTAKL